MPVIVPHFLYPISSYHLIPIYPVCIISSITPILHTATAFTPSTPHSFTPSTPIISFPFTQSVPFPPSFPLPQPSPHQHPTPLPHQLLSYHSHLPSLYHSLHPSHSSHCHSLHPTPLPHHLILIYPVCTISSIPFILHTAAAFTPTPHFFTPSAPIISFTQFVPFPQSLSFFTLPQPSPHQHLTLLHLNSLRPSDAYIRQ